MPLAPDGTWRRPTDAETDLTQDVTAAISRAQADPGDAHPDDPVHLAIAAVQAVIDARWTPPRDVRIPIDTEPRFPAGHFDTTTETR